MDTMIVFYGTCINAKSSNPFIDDGFIWCRMKDGYFECEYKDRWNECQDFKPVRTALCEIKEPPDKQKREVINNGFW